MRLKLLAISDTHLGEDTSVLSFPRGRQHLWETLRTQFGSGKKVEIEEMIADGTITSGMMPKVEACMNALNGGVPKAHIIDGRIEHSLLLEIYTEKGIGTQILK